jgi:glycoprotein 3-alpha-L-fucosyltransferase
MFFLYFVICGFMLSYLLNRWKYEGPSDSFKALVDMAAVHSSCRLCIHLATKSREKEEKSPDFKKRPCKCTRGSETVYHIYVRERGTFEMESIYLRYTYYFDQ